MRDNYKIDVFLKSSKINGVQKISKLTAKRNDKEVNLHKQKFINNQEILTLMKNRFNINNKIERVEAYDNSFFGNNYAVASYVVFNEEGFSIKDLSLIHISEPTRRM